MATLKSDEKFVVRNLMLLSLVIKNNVFLSLAVLSRNRYQFKFKFENEFVIVRSSVILLLWLHFTNLKYDSILRGSNKIIEKLIVYVSLHLLFTFIPQTEGNFKFVFIISDARTWTVTEALKNTRVFRKVRFKTL